MSCTSRWHSLTVLMYQPPVLFLLVKLDCQKQPMDQWNRAVCINWQSALFRTCYSKQQPWLWNKVSSRFKTDTSQPQLSCFVRFPGGRTFLRGGAVRQAVGDLEESHGEPGGIHTTIRGGTRGRVHPHTRGPLPPPVWPHQEIMVSLLLLSTFPWSAVQGEGGSPPLLGHRDSFVTFLSNSSWLVLPGDYPSHTIRPTRREERLLPSCPSAS